MTRARSAPRIGIWSQFAAVLPSDKLVDACARASELAGQTIATYLAGTGNLYVTADGNQRVARMFLEDACADLGIELRVDWFP